MHLGRNIAGSVGSYLPDVLTEIWEPTRDFASLKLPSAGVRSLVALSRYDDCLNVDLKKITLLMPLCL